MRNLRRLTTECLILCALMIALAVPRLAMGAATPTAAPAFNAPATMTHTLEHDGRTLTLRLIRVDARAPDFEVLLEQPDGSLRPVAGTGERSYLGTVDQEPGAVASGIVLADGTITGQISFDRGVTWSFRGGEVTPSSDGGEIGLSTFAFPTSPSLGPEVAGTSSYRVDVAIDISNQWFRLHALGSPARALELIELSMSSINATYQRDALLQVATARVIIRADSESDTYGSLRLDPARLTTVRDYWRDVQTTSAHDQVMLIRLGRGGLAFLDSLGTDNGASVSGASWQGTFTVVGRHELAHNWGPRDNHSGAPEGPTIMDGNRLSRFSGPDLAAIMARRDGVLGSLDDIGVFSTVDLPPYATLDVLDGVVGLAAAAVDLLANDHDANGHELELVSVSSESALGGLVAWDAAGSTVTYTPPVVGAESTDYVTYVVRDSSGQTATGLLVARVLPANAALAALDPGDQLPSRDSRSLLSADETSRTGAAPATRADLRNSALVALAGVLGVTVAAAIRSRLRPAAGRDYREVV